MIDSRPRNGQPGNLHGQAPSGELQFEPDIRVIVVELEVASLGIRFGAFCVSGHHPILDIALEPQRAVGIGVQVEHSHEWALELFVDGAVTFGHINVESAGL